ncbi:hypothetical protein TDB9533_03686 [Thalassocella blandensis]|nr:hypothetical protein TDB9533_03686 [Thalassocella blandensis]
MSLMDDMYEKINEVLGAGDQLFCMEFPARPLNASRFRYDTSDRNSVLTKPYSVQEAEFRLSDALYNTAPMVQGTNGKQLSVVYDSLLNNYVPKLSELKDFIVDKFDVRKFLLEKVEDEIDGAQVSCSRMELCQRLYNKYLNEKNNWLQQKDSEFDSYRGKDDLDGFAKWVSSEGIVRDEKLNNLFNDVVVRGHYHEVLTILGFLNVASSAETLEKSKQNMRHCSRKSLDASTTIYPVQFQPNDWFKSLNSSFAPKDLLGSQETIQTKYDAKRKQLSDVRAQLSEMKMLSSSPEEISELEQKVEDGKTALKQAEQALMEQYGQGVMTAFKIYLKAHTGGGIATASELSEKQESLSTADKEKDDKLKEKLGLGEDVIKQMTDTYSKQSELLQASEQLANLQRLKVKAESKDYGLQIQILTSKKDALSEEVEWLANMLGGIAHSDLNGEEASSQVLPTGEDVEDTEYTDVTIIANTEESNESSRESSSSSNKSWKVSGWFASAGGNKSSASASSSLESSNFSKKIEIGFRVTKVSIDRGGWFNPSIFDVSNAYYRLAEFGAGAGLDVQTIKKKVEAKGSLTDLLQIQKDGKTIPSILPSYPVGFVIAKDITVKISVDSSQLSVAKKEVEKSAASGGGFFGFSASSSSSSSSSSSDMYQYSDSDSLMIRIPGPQILGWFLQLPPQDQSTPYESLTSSDIDLKVLSGELKKYDDKNEQVN